MKIQDEEARIQALRRRADIYYLQACATGLVVAVLFYGLLTLHLQIEYTEIGLVLLLLPFFVMIERWKYAVLHDVLGMNRKRYLWQLLQWARLKLLPKK